MLRLSKKADYAVIVLSSLYESEHPLSAHEVADRYELPRSMVANILKELVGAEIISSTRGQQGGYSTAKPMNQVSLADVIQAVESPFAFIECAHVEDACKIQSCCPTRSPLLAVHQHLERFMASLTLDQIINVSHRSYGFEETLS